MAAGTTVSILPCGAMTADLTWLLLAPNRSIRNRHNKHLPAEWVDVPTHCVLVDTPDGRLGGPLGCDRPAGLLPLRQGLRGGVPGLPAQAARRRPGRYRLRRPVPPALRPCRQRQALQGDKRQAGLQRQGEGVGLRLRRPVQRRSPQGRLRRPGLRDRRRGRRVPPRGQLHPDARPHPRQHVDAGRPARVRDDDLHG
jgi:hypothetical protein